MSKKNPKPKVVSCDASDPMDCSNPDYVSCVIEKHRKSATQHQSMVINPDIDPRIVSMEGLGLPMDECGNYLVKITFDPDNTDSNEDIAVSVVEWAKEKRKKKSTDLTKLDVYYSVILFNGLINNFDVSSMEMRKANEGGARTVVIRCRESLFKYYHGNLTSQFPIESDPLP